MREIVVNIKELPQINAETKNVTVQSGEGGTTRHSRLTERELPDQHPIAAISGLSEILENKAEAFLTDETLEVKNGVMGVVTAHEPEPDNTLPITAAAVATTVGNIEILLSKI